MRIGKAKRVLSLLLLAVPGLASAQHEFDAWRFGINAGLQFGPVPAAAPPVAVVGSALNSAEACASVADAAGQLRCYTDGRLVWNRLNQPMPNGQLNGGDNSAAQGALLVPDPASPDRYYLFTVDAVENALSGGLRYSVVDLSLNNGLGDVLQPGSQVLSPASNYRFTEGLTAVRDRTETGYWLVVHGANTADFYAYHLQATGLLAQPQRSTVGSVHANNFQTRQPAANVMLRASPDGRTLAAGVPQQGVELVDFDNATGQVSNPRRVPLVLYRPYGLEFSADNTKLYVSEIGQGTLHQYDLLTSAPPVLLADQGPGGIGGVQRGPDDRIYVARANAYFLGVIASPNRPGLACDYQPGQIALGTRRCYSGLPNFPNGLARNAPQLLAPAAVCTGQVVSFQARSGVTGTVFTWDFGEPVAGGANVAQGPLVQHRYAGPGTYQVRLTQTSGADSFSLNRTVVVEPVAVLSLVPADTLLCPGSPLMLQLTGYLPGSTLIWSDGGPGLPRHPVTGPGRFSVRAISPAGCETTASTTAAVKDCSVVAPMIPNIITPNDDDLNQAFVLKGLNAPDWALRIYNRWGVEIYSQEKYDNTWSAKGHPDGLYYYLLSNAQTGQKYKGWVEVVR